MYFINSATLAMQQHVRSVSPIVVNQTVPEAPSPVQVQNNQPHVVSMAGAAIKANQARDIIFNLSEADELQSSESYVEELLAAVKATEATETPEMTPPMPPKIATAEEIAPVLSGMDLEQTRQGVADAFQNDSPEDKGDYELAA